MARNNASPLTRFGHDMRQHFLQNENWINLNHGSHGTFPRQVAAARLEIAKVIEVAPDKFLRYDYKALLNESRHRVAQYLQVPVDECVLAQNVTVAMDAVLKNLSFVNKDVVLCFETIYDAVEKSLLYIQEINPQVKFFKVGHNCSKDFRLPMSHADIVSLFVETVEKLQDQGYHVKVAVFDTITSVPAIRLPFEQLTRICHEYGILSVIDGAHGIGQIPLDLSSLDADFFVSNCHKWLYTPRSCAVLHVPTRNQHLIRNTVPTSYLFVPRSRAYIREESRGEQPPGFVELFQNIATMDNTPLYCIPAALDFRANVCGNETDIFGYMKNIAQKGADIIAKELGTFVMGGDVRLSSNNSVPVQKRSPGPETFGDGSLEISHRETEYTELRDCAMATIALPIHIHEEHGDHIGTQGGINSGDARRVASWMQRTLTDYNTTASIFVYDRKFWVRVMGQIYLELSDFEWFAGILKEMCTRVENGEGLN